MKIERLDFSDILVLILVLSLFCVPFCFGIKILVDCYYANKSSQEKICVEYYKENHYVLNECEKYSDKLNSME